MGPSSGASTTFTATPTTVFTTNFSATLPAATTLSLYTVVFLLRSEIVDLC